MAAADVHAARHAGETSPVAHQHALRHHGDWFAVMICVTVHLLSPANNVGLICRADYAATNRACQEKNEG
jgi:hypothetical protein